VAGAEGMADPSSEPAGLGRTWATHQVLHSTLIHCYLEYGLGTHSPRSANKVNCAPRCGPGAKDERMEMGRPEISEMPELPTVPLTLPYALRSTVTLFL
jgi:hypothetical protein